MTIMGWKLIQLNFMTISSEQIEPQELTISDHVCLQDQTDTKV